LLTLRLVRLGSTTVRKTMTHPAPSSRLQWSGVAVWLLYGEPYDLVERGSELFDRLEVSFSSRPALADRERLAARSGKA
jgi:hypothetical protein